MKYFGIQRLYWYTGLLEAAHNSVSDHYKHILDPKWLQIRVKIKKKYFPVIIFKLLKSNTNLMCISYQMKSILHIQILIIHSRQVFWTHPEPKQSHTTKNELKNTLIYPRQQLMTVTFSA